MAGSVIVSVRIPHELKERVEGLGVSLSAAVREALERYVREAELEAAKKILDGLAEAYRGRVSPELVAKLVREDRSAR